MIGDGAADLDCAHACATLILVSNALHSPGLAQIAEDSPNVYITEGRAGTGWAEMARLLLAAKGVVPEGSLK
jgi:hypothetical protein